MEIIHAHFPSRYPLLGITYSNISGVYQSKTDNSKALDYFEKALEIYQKSLPTNHPLLALSHHNLSVAFNGLHQHKKAVEHGKCAVDIARHSSGDDQAQLQMYINFLDELGERL
jgi:tetratricopeptide (TPR) repeat protein